MASQRAATAAITGFFVDWTGVTRSVSNPGASYKYVQSVDSRFVEVLGSDGGVVHEADLWPSLDELKAAGIPIKHGSSSANTAE
ncbi:hypothetical protein [Pseudomonas baetica]|uniref:hypothetical protein n=1 Tax=Pseudomonas baetica TaxID=674054 RepID=UPI002405CBA2|nr:hypothetical protein [Pseudomonas baetica]MDF9779071.1 hypothetical protein [Pseudomonas baetica]